MKAFVLLTCGLAMLMAPRCARADLPTLVHVFAQTDTPLRLTPDGAGNFYGVEPAGGDYGNGSVIKIAANGTVAVLYSFAGPTVGSAPLPLTLGADGNLYGFTTRGGTTATNFGNLGHGTFFRITPAGAFTLLANFNVSDDVVGPTIPPILLADGSFEGLADGSGSGRGGAIFHVDASGAVTVVVSYPEVNSSRNVNLPSNLISAGGGVFYASTPTAGLGYGTVFRLNADASTTLLLTFGNDSNGGRPDGLVYAGDGTLYGITGSGGDNGAGTFYKVSPQGAFSTLTSLTAGSSSLVTAANDSAVTRAGNVLYHVLSGGTPAPFYTAPANVGGVLDNGDGTFTVSLAGAV